MCLPGRCTVLARNIQGLKTYTQSDSKGGAHINNKWHEMWCVYLAGVLFQQVTSKAWKRILKVIQKGPAQINNKWHEMWCVYLAGVLFQQVTSKAWRRILKVIQKGPAHINNKWHEMWCVYLAGVLFRQVTSKAWRGSEFQTRSAELCPDTVNSHSVNIYTRSLCLSLKPNCKGRFFTAN